MLNPLPPIVLAPFSNGSLRTPARLHAMRSRAYATACVLHTVALTFIVVRWCSRCGSLLMSLQSCLVPPGSPRMAVSAIQQRLVPLVCRHWRSAASIVPCGLRAQRRLRAPQGQGASIRTWDVPFRPFVAFAIVTLRIHTPLHLSDCLFVCLFG